MGKRFEQIGMDRSIAHIGVIMEKFDTHNYPKFQLPSGFHFTQYREGYENKWAELQFEVEGFDTLQAAKDLFYNEFLCGLDSDWINKRKEIMESWDIERYPYFNQMHDKMVFVVDHQGHIVGTGAVWKGNTFGSEYQRLHWIAVKPEFQGLGISKAIISRLLDIYNELGYKEYIYLTSQTWSYKALHIYSKFGFMPYMGEKPKNWDVQKLSPGSAEPWDYKAKNKEAWEIINSKILEYKRSLISNIE